MDIIRISWGNKRVNPEEEIDWPERVEEESWEIRFLKLFVINTQ